MQSALRVAAAVPESVAPPEPVVLVRFGEPDRRTPPGQWLTKGNRKEKGTNFVSGTYQFSRVGTAPVAASSVVHQLGALSRGPETNFRIAHRPAPCAH